jgi:NAD(P)H-hydrate epimerase
MTGAAGLCGRAALRGGAGLVYVATAEDCLDVVASYEPSYLTIPLPLSSTGDRFRIAADSLRERLETFSAVAIGPGCGQSAGIADVVVTFYAEARPPVVVDADALNILATRRERLSTHGGPRVLTPHVGEFARLTGESMEAIAARREELAVDFAGRHGVVLVLKGPGSIVTDGQRLYVNTTGNSGMGTGGTGDVLTGLLAALLAQGMPAFEAAQLGVWMHGRAGDLAAKEHSQPGMIASDLPEHLCDVWKELRGGG